MWSASELMVATASERVVAGDADALPVERRRDLQRNAREWGLAGVADGDECACGELLRGGVEAHVEIKAGDGDCLALGVVNGRSVGGLRGRLCCGTGGADGVAVGVERALEEDLAGWLGGLRRRLESAGS